MIKNLHLLLLLFLISCHNVQKGKITVRLLSSDSRYQIEKRDSDLFEKAFGSFYKDKNGLFFVASIFDTGSPLKPAPILIQIPTLDSISFRQDGQYLVDKSKVICVFGNSDGGNYVVLKNVDPSSFQVFRNVFGGRDSAHVFFKTNFCWA